MAATAAITILLHLSIWPLSTAGYNSHENENLATVTACYNDQPEAYKSSNETPPPLPSLPTQFSTSVEANIRQRAWSSMVVEHYDAPNQRASVFFTFNGSTVRTLFNFQQGETYIIYPNGTCLTRQAQPDYLGFFKTSAQHHRPVMATVKEMFHLGPGYNFSYVGETRIKGILVNHWTSCQEWTSVGAKFRLDYYFSHPDYQTAWGQGEVPIRAVLNGTATNVNMHHQRIKGSHQFSHVYDFTSFHVGPVQDESVFQLPLDTVCEGRNDQRPMPRLPDSFKIKIEVPNTTILNRSKSVPNSPHTNSPLFSQSQGLLPIPPMELTVHYDWDNRLVEVMERVPLPPNTYFEPSHTWNSYNVTDGSRVFPRDLSVFNKIRIVKDYNTKVQYTIEDKKSICQVSKLEGVGDEMKPGHSIFDIPSHKKTDDSKFTYQGHTRFRGIPVDAWGIHDGDVLIKVLFLQDSMSDNRNRGPVNIGGSGAVSSYPVLVGVIFKNQTVSKTDGYDEERLRYDVNLPSAPFTNLLTQAPYFYSTLRHAGEANTHVFQFLPLNAAAGDDAGDTFQVSQCFSPDQTRHVQLRVKAPFQETTKQDYRAPLTIAIRRVLARAMHVPYLHVTKVRLARMEFNRTRVTFDVLGTPLFSTHTRSTTVKTQTDIREAMDSLLSAVRNGIIFSVPQGKIKKYFSVDKSWHSINDITSGESCGLSTEATKENSGTNKNSKDQLENMQIESEARTVDEGNSSDTGKYLEISTPGRTKTNVSRTKPDANIKDLTGRTVNSQMQEPSGGLDRGISSSTVVGIALASLIAGLALATAGFTIYYKLKLSLHGREIPYQHQHDAKS